MVPQLAVRKNISAQVTGPLADGIWTGWRESLPAVAVNKTCDGRAVRPTILAAPFWPPLSQRIVRVAGVAPGGCDVAAAAHLPPLLRKPPQPRHYTRPDRLRAYAPTMIR